MRRLLLAALLTACAVVGAAPPASAQDQQSPPVIKVLEAGSEPRSQLRYVLTPGTTQRSLLKVNTRITQTVGDQGTRSGATPQIELDVSTTIGEPTQDAVIMTFSFDDIRVAEGSGQSELEDALEPLVGFDVTITSTNRGEVLATEGDIPPDLDETTGQLLEQFLQQARALTVPFPEEAVGEGARWSARTDTAISGIEIRQTSRFELLNVTDDGVELQVDITQRAPRQTYADPASGVEVELVSSRGGGDGKVTLAFGSPLPTEYDTHVQVKQKLRAEGERISQSITANVFLDDA